MNDFKRCALFLKANDPFDESIKLKRLHDYADANDYIITITLRSEQEFLSSKEAFDIIITTETIMLPIAGIEIIKI